jgi:hypothetical protein
VPLLNAVTPNKVNLDYTEQRFIGTKSLCDRP